MKQGNLSVVKGLAERVIRVNPKFGAVYLYYGVALKNENKMKEAMNAFRQMPLASKPISTKSKAAIGCSVSVIEQRKYGWPG